jgi:hypothetical protein
MFLVKKSDPYGGQVHLDPYSNNMLKRMVTKPKLHFYDFKYFIVALFFAPRLRKSLPARQTLLFPTFFERSPVQILLSGIIPTMMM